MFSPGGWLTEAEDRSMDDDSDSSVLSEFNRPPPVSIRHHQTPRNPIDEFHKIQNQKVEDSPNARLADFFAKKGNEPLSEIEIEGVKSLLAKNNSEISSPQTPHNGDDTNNQISQVLKSQRSESSIKTTPSFKATYNKSISEDNNTFDNSINSITSTRKRRVFDFSGFPSPYRTSRFKDTSFLLDDNDTKKSNLSSESTIGEVNTPKKDKKLSNTASALLSFIEGKDDETTKKYEEQQLKPDKKIDYSNPYASISSSHRRTKSKPSKFEQEFEKYKDELDKKKEKQEPEIPQLRYKPNKSSSLRETVSLNDTDQSIEDIDVSENKEDTQESEPKQEVKPQHAKPQEAKPQEEEKEKESKFNSKPLFSFAKTIPTSIPGIPQPKQTTNTTNQSQIAPFTFSGSVITQDTRPPSSDFTFTFPKAESTGYTLNDVDEELVNYYKPYFKF